MNETITRGRWFHARGFRVACALSAIAMLAGAASAGTSPFPSGFDILCEWDTGSWAASNHPTLFDWVPDGSGGGTVLGEWTLGTAWSGVFDGTGFSTGSTSVFGNFAFTNTSGVTQTFTVTVMSPLTQVLPGQTQISGSIGGSLVDTGGGGAEVASLPGGSIYNALVDGNNVRTLMDDFSYDVPPGFADSLPPESFDWEPGPFGAFSSIAIQHTFTLTPGDSVTFSSAFHIIPTPGAIAIFALAGMMGTRRRRN